MTERRSREQSQAPEATDVAPTLAPKMPSVNMLAVLLRSHLLGHATPSRGNKGGAQHLRKQGVALSGSNMPCSKAMDEIPGCTAQLLEVGIPWNQDFLASLLQGSADSHTQFFQETATGLTAFLCVQNSQQP